MPAPQRIKELVENFKANFDHVQSNDYKEEDLRNHYLNPFFQELGWDMEDKAGKGPLRDLHYEKTIKSGAPDYGFYTDGKLRFFVEAKNPSKNVCDDPPAALQLRGYGWSAKTARGILTDFEELSIYDTTVRPKAADQARVARLDCIKYTEFVERWDEIHALFSREAVLGGSLEKLEKKRAKDAVDDGLLEDISSWRDLLARNIANRNKLSEERLNRIVQDTIGRLLFLRICEDRGIAHEGDLREVAEGDGNYAKLFKLFKKAEQRYDSDLFEVASISDLVIDDKVLKEIISELYFPKSPYKFDAIPAEILGQVYEQFLGKVIRLTEGGHAKVEEKPEVRKAGGIYYTPAYIVEYIVRNTVGKLVEGKTPKKIETLSIVDPACGSGSFLLGAYKFLVDWYRDWYVADGAEKHQKAKRIYMDAAKQWQLTLDERKRILTAHIYGVDLDRQAVEMAKLSLMLEALRAPEQQSLFNERMLPRMGDNIKCGNALIGTEYFAGQQDTDLAEMARINAFDWLTEFSEVFKRGGFDAVIGNPPYIKEFVNKAAFDGLRSSPYYQGKMDLWTIFASMGIDHLRDGGLLSFIAPNNWPANYGASKFRTKIVCETKILSYLDFKDFKVFPDAGIQTMVLVVKKEKVSEQHFEARLLINSAHEESVISHSLVDEAFGSEYFRKVKVSIKPSSYSGSTINFVDPKNESILKKIVAKQNFTIDKKEVSQGIVAAPDEYFLVESTTPFNADEKRYLKKWYTGCARYSSAKNHGHIFYLNAKNFKNSLSNYPNIEKHFIRFKKELTEAKIKYKTPKKPYFYLHRERDERFFSEGPKIISATRTHRPSFFYTEEEYYASRAMNIIQTSRVEPKYLTGILNSRLVWFWLKNKGKLLGDLLQIDSGPLLEIPIYITHDRAEASKVIAFVDQLTDLSKKLLLCQEQSARTALQRQLQATDGQLDRLVYGLYGLTNEEIRIVEEGTK